MGRRLVITEDLSTRVLTLMIESAKSLTTKQVSTKLRDKYAVKDSSTFYGVNSIQAALKSLVKANKVVAKESNLKGKVYIYSLKRNG